MDNLREIARVLSIGMPIALYLLNTNRVVKAIELMKECLIFLETNALKGAGAFYMFVVNSFYRDIYRKMFVAYWLSGDFKNTIECGVKLQILLRESGKKCKTEGWVSFLLGTLQDRHCKYKEARELYLEALGIMIETGETKGELFRLLLLGNACSSLGEFGKAKQYLEKAHSTAKEMGDKETEYTCNTLLGSVFQSHGEYVKAIEYYEKVLNYAKEIGNKEDETSCYGNLGDACKSLEKYDKAKEYYNKALNYAKEIGNKKGEASCYANLGDVFKSLGEYTKAKEYYEIAVAIWKEIGYSKEKETSFGRLGEVLSSLGDFAKARKFYDKQIASCKETGNREGEAEYYRQKAGVLWSLGEYAKAKEYFEKALAIRSATGTRKDEAVCYEELGRAFLALNEYDNAIVCLRKALAFASEVCDSHGEARNYGHLGIVFGALGKYLKAKEYFQEAVLLFKDTGDSVREGFYYCPLAFVCYKLGEYAEAVKYYKKSSRLSRETGNTDREALSHAMWSIIMLMEGNIHEVEALLSANIYKYEEMLTSIGHNDLFKMSFVDDHFYMYRFCSIFFTGMGSNTKALHAEEYAVENQVSANPRTFAGIQRIVNDERNCLCLYISYEENLIFLWILKADRLIHYRQICIEEGFDNKFSSRNVDEVFGRETWRKFQVLAEEQCEDRSWFSSNAYNSAFQSPAQTDFPKVFGLVKNEEDENQQPVPTLADCYKMIITPMADLLDETEIIFVPDRVFFKVPFAALEDENGNYLSESLRIRVVPSLMSLKLIQDSPADHHSQTGTLIVGDPDVGEVLYKESLEKVSRLPFAGEEAKMIGELLGTQPLLGKQATKQAVLESINSVSLIHFAAHGDAERGEIVLAPPPAINRTPEEEDYLLTMADVSQVRLRAKLVVLSCCHSAKGQIRAEGVVGIARAFLGSGARSVLVALWAIEDKATKQFMSCFYEHLVRGESASESLHQAMKWMRGNGFCDVRQWAPFMLIGDNVTFDFGN